MHQRLAILGAACSFAASCLLCSPAFGQLRSAVPPAAADQADVPVREVVLFSSGVGYFEHFGSVKADASTELRFKTDQINDVLKSLLLQDMDGGTVGTVSYPGQAPLAHTLKSFQIDITDNPNMADLLNQLRGAKITLSLTGANKVSGKILGVEKKPKIGADKGGPIEINVINLKEGRQFRAIPLDDVQSMELENPKLEKELDDALDALEQSRDQDKKPVTINFRGVGERRVRIGYVVETPVWKTSYRLVLGEDAEAMKNGNGKHPGPKTAEKTEEKDNAAPPPGAAVNPPAIARPDQISAKLQGWAIIDNQTDNDWKDVQLSLVSGRPLSFIQDLYHSLYIPRPVVQPNIFASLVPQTYSSGVSKEDAEKMETGGDANNQHPQGGGGIGAGGGGGGGMSLFEGAGAKERLAPMDPTTSVISAASAAKIGELFQYTIGSVSLGRQKSAMIPIVTDDIEAERLSIYNAGVLPEHPLLGARVKNTTKKYLLQGPITVLDRGRYAGDARIEDVPPGQERYISYGIDQQVLIAASQYKEETMVLTGKIAKGFLEVTSKDVHEQTFVADNKSDDVKTLIIEQPRQNLFKLTSPKEADETTTDVYRFRRKLDPHKALRLTVVSEFIGSKVVQISPGSADVSLVYLNEGAIPKTVRDALAKAIQMESEIVALNRQFADRTLIISSINSEQARMRENMKAVSADTDYYKRLAKKLDEQETAIEKTQKEMTENRKASEALSKQLADYLANLTVE